MKPVDGLTVPVMVLFEGVTIVKFPPESRVLSPASEKPVSAT